MKEMNLALAILIGGVGGVILGVYAGYMDGVLINNGYVYSGDLVNDGFWVGVVGAIVGAVYPRGRGKTKSRRL
ncbi:MAG: hypothetical protein OK438_01975 [Thaumarchaeota archaeon]|nr:hypothetical protein [Nitrososphaerota archaeon]